LIGVSHGVGGAGGCCGKEEHSYTWKQMHRSNVAAVSSALQFAILFETARRDR
jgi:hypothetical protein